MLDFFRRLKAEGKVVFVCLHPNEPYHVEVMRELCERFIFVHRGRLSHGGSIEDLGRLPQFRDYLGSLWPGGREPNDASLSRPAGATPSGA
jgi:hypothetical protein